MTRHETLDLRMKPERGKKGGWGWSKGKGGRKGPHGWKRETRVKGDRLRTKEVEGKISRRTEGWRRPASLTLTPTPTPTPSLLRAQPALSALRGSALSLLARGSAPARAPSAHRSVCPGPRRARAGRSETARGPPDSASHERGRRSSGVNTQPLRRTPSDKVLPPPNDAPLLRLWQVKRGETEPTATTAEEEEGDVASLGHGSTPRPWSSAAMRRVARPSRLASSIAVADMGERGGPDAAAAAPLAGQRWRLDASPLGWKMGPAAVEKEWEE